MHVFKQKGVYYASINGQILGVSTHRLIAIKQALEIWGELYMR